MNGRRTPSRSDLLQILIWGLEIEDLKDISRVLKLAEYEVLSKKEIANLADRISVPGIVPATGFSEQSTSLPIAEVEEVVEDGSLRTLLNQAESLEHERRPLAAEAVLNQCMKTAVAFRNRELMHKKLDSLRHRNILRFFDPDNNLPTTIVFDREHKGRLSDHTKPTTQTWAFQVESILQELARDSFLKPPEMAASNYEAATIHDLVRQRRNLVTYASSKINPCTEDMLEILNPLLGLDIRFVYERDVGHKQRSTFTHKRRGERAALVFRGKAYKSAEVDSQGRDYGILLKYRFPKEGGRQWIVFAGSSQAGSVATRLLVFDREFGQQLWAHPGLKEPLESFLCVFEMSYNPPKHAEPKRIEVIEICQFPQEPSSRQQ